MDGLRSAVIAVEDISIDKGSEMCDQKNPRTAFEIEVQIDELIMSQPDADLIDLDFLKKVEQALLPLLASIESRIKMHADAKKTILFCEPEMIMMTGEQAKDHLEAARRIIGRHADE